MGASGRIAASIVVVVGALLLSGCTPEPPTPSPPPTASETAAPTPSSTATPTPSEAPPAAEAPAEAERIEITAETISVIADDGSLLAAYDYFQPTDEVIAGLSSYLGAPVDTWFEGRGHAPPATFHDWGGLRIADTVPSGRAPYDPEHWARVTSGDANGVSLATLEGITVGDPIAPVESGMPGDEPYRWTSPETGDASVSFRIGIVELPPMHEPHEDDWTPSFGVMIVGDDSAGVITSLVAPSANFGA